MTYSK